MQIKQWEDKNLAQFSYGILSDCEKKIVLIDPARNTQPYLDYAAENNAAITGIIETHPHADFVSSHLELHQVTGATIYAHSCLGASYPHRVFDEGDTIHVGKIKLSALHTPGHSPDSISILLEHDGKQKAVFTGDTLFIGDCGRPDLREGAGNLRETGQGLARKMYHSLRDKLMTLEDDVIVYPGHGAGSLCGKGLSEAAESTIGKEKQMNWSLQPMTPEKFVQELLSDQPFVPAYFPFDVELNRQGASPLGASIDAVPVGDSINDEADVQALEKGVWIIDARPEAEYKKGHLPYSINLMEKGKFETWLGSIIQPGEAFYLAGENKDQLRRIIERTAVIGYETQVKKAFISTWPANTQQPLDLDHFKNHAHDYTIIDVRNSDEVEKNKPFENSIAIPLSALRDQLKTIPTTKPIVVHCAGGYRSAAGSSIIQSSINGKTPVFDLGDAIKQFL